MCVRIVYKMLLVCGLLILWVTTAGAAEWSVEYPYNYTVEHSSTVWNVETGAKLKDLKFDWKQTEGILTLNGDQIYPALPKSSPRPTEEKMERLYGRYPLVVRFYRQSGSWVDAVSKYQSFQLSFLDSLNIVCRQVAAGAVDREVFDAEVESILRSDPYSDIFDPEKGVEVLEDRFVIYEKRPGRQSSAYPKAFADTVSVGIERRGNVSAADGIVRQIVGFLRVRPDEPHLILVGEGGVLLSVFGHDEVESYTAELSRVITSDTYENTLGLQERWIKNISESMGVEK